MGDGEPPYPNTPKFVLREGKTYFFESEKNLDLFRDNPEKYLGKGE